jgi:acylphosphatase
MKMKRKAFQAKVYGKVQGVWFRKYTRDKAVELGLKGFVRNEADGTVYVEAEGEPEATEILKKWLYTGSPASKVEKVEIRDIEPAGYENFEITY